uniref:Uncharacterized protein AlNc14C38G3314 n=1 Tax=Albugo laibachii Nc14 TaxID=890382 RepID=F0W948_9STRA|nr:conserved hypothetical protein [Albugo laibachii Nc14]|eukprot:CCA17660.1 conserved hypothetical protein [Albugo laibachii Nc14]
MKRNGGGWNQTVCDDEGRRRFHGAFQGGFSAGYYNTVGSKEGWTPKPFKSSKTTRVRVQQHLEDFMDEDDDPLLGKQLKTSDKFDTLHENEKTKLNSIKFHESIKPLQFSFPTDWLLPTRPSIGTHLLCKTGWKPGMGIGPKYKKRLDNHPTLTSVYMNPKPHLTPSDFPPLKSNTHGLGFDPFKGAPEFQRFRLQKEEKFKAQAQRQILSFATSLQAPKSILASSEASSTHYGLGALEDDDDIDIYGPSLLLQDVDMEIGKRPKKTQKMIMEEVKIAQVSELGFTRGREEQKSLLLQRLYVPKDFSEIHNFPEMEAKSVTSHLYEKYQFSQSDAKAKEAEAKKSVFELLSSQQIDRIRQSTRKEENYTQGVVAPDFFVNRFVSAGHSQTREEKTRKADTLQSKERAKVYRSEEIWIPTSLLCKRWGVKCSRSTQPLPINDRKSSVDSFLQSTMNSMATIPPREAEEKDEPDLPDLMRPSESLLKVIFEPSDESIKEEDSSDEIQEIDEREEPSSPKESEAFVEKLDDGMREKMLKKLERSLHKKHKKKHEKSRKRSREDAHKKKKDKRRKRSAV